MSDRFNNLPASTDSLVNPFRYTARESDTETDLYYYRARYYNSTLQRFISEDPVGLRGGLNLFRYVHNDPVNFKDPSGHGESPWHFFETYDAARTSGMSIFGCPNLAVPLSWSQY
ncbi:MAG: hypothetical protein DMG45_23335 [Acidobacteria bacterium]|nr:MAG: hypothetical protein DMG45_23335 [Acidobacteriota bacterium]PYT41460.1 MAG: hypothetical protein DMG47_17490 [Acidobacteriota bacterium]PYU55822.1 MAG: hypothetical protein DMG55_26260 [Acidobacteriota bacterium]